VVAAESRNFIDLSWSVDAGGAFLSDRFARKQPYIALQWNERGSG
jgi:hypothetical protein